MLLDRYQARVAELFAQVRETQRENIIKAGTTSPYSMYNESIASFKTGDQYDHHDAAGFITLFGLSTKVRAMKLQEVAKKQGIKDWQNLL